MLEPRGRGLILWTLRYGDEVRHFDAAPEAEEAPDKAALGLVKKLISERTQAFEPEMVHDPVQEGLIDLIASKRKKRPAKKAAKAAAEEPPGGNVVSIMDALRRSLSAEKGKRK
jgi:DNA end-binding protein Ku